MSEQELEQEEVQVVPIKVPGTVPEYPDDFILFKRRGWTFGHFRKWETVTTENLVILVCERIESWSITGEDGKPIPFEPTNEVPNPKFDEKTNPDVEPLLVVPNPDVWDKLSPGQAAWVTASFRMAYVEAGLPDPN